jgi:hypothetical protein
MPADVQDHYGFDDVELGGFVLTVVADRQAPQHQHIQIEPQIRPTTPGCLYKDE